MLALIGYIVDYRLLNACTIRQIIDDKWGLRGEVTVHSMGDLFILHCSNSLDYLNILHKQVASFKGALMVFKAWEPLSSPHTIRFTHAWLWMRVYGLPFEYMSMHVAGVIQNMLGGKVEIESFHSLPHNDYIRIRVKVCLSEPLVPGFFLSVDNETLLWVQFKYEEISKYCVRCGKIGHKQHGCTESKERIETSVEKVMQRFQARDFHVHLTEAQHTMFNIDLRANNSNSRIRFDSNCDNRESRGFFYFGDPRADIRRCIKPGMIFSWNEQPFSDAVLLHQNHVQFAHGDNSYFHNFQQCQSNDLSTLSDVASSASSGILDNKIPSSQGDQIFQTDVIMNYNVVDVDMKGDAEAKGHSTNIPIIPEELSGERTMNQTVFKSENEVMDHEVLIDDNAMPIATEPAPVEFAFLYPLTKVVTPTLVVPQFCAGSSADASPAQNVSVVMKVSSSEAIGNLGLDDDQVDGKQRHGPVQSLGKRKCRMDTEVPGEILLTVGHAKSYLAQLLKRFCVDPTRHAVLGVNHDEGAFHVKVGAGDFMGSKENSVPNGDLGVAEVGLTQPPHPI